MPAVHVPNSSFVGRPVYCYCWHGRRIPGIILLCAAVCRKAAKRSRQSAGLAHALYTFRQDISSLTVSSSLLFYFPLFRNCPRTDLIKSLPMNISCNELREISRNTLDYVNLPLTFTYVPTSGRRPQVGHRAI
jgi:hypothetical protein